MRLFPFVFVSITKSSCVSLSFGSQNDYVSLFSFVSFVFCRHFTKCLSLTKWNLLVSTSERSKMKMLKMGFFGLTNTWIVYWWANRCNFWRKVKSSNETDVFNGNFKTNILCQKCRRSFTCMNNFRIAFPFVFIRTISQYRFCKFFDCVFKMKIFFLLVSRLSMWYRQYHIHSIY